MISCCKTSMIRLKSKKGSHKRPCYIHNASKLFIFMRCMDFHSAASSKLWIDRSRQWDKPSLSTSKIEEQISCWQHRLKQRYCKTDISGIKWLKPVRQTSNRRGKVTSKVCRHLQLIINDRRWHSKMPKWAKFIAISWQISRIKKATLPCNLKLTWTTMQTNQMCRASKWNHFQTNLWTKSSSSPKIISTWSSNASRSATLTSTLETILYPNK